MNPSIRTCVQFDEPKGKALFESPAVKSRLLQRERLFRKIIAERDRVHAYLSQEMAEEAEFVAACHEHVRSVVLVLGSPRGGTSAFKQLLSESRQLISFPAEHRFLFTLIGATFPDHGRLDESAADDALAAEQTRFVLRNLFHESCRESTAEPTASEIERCAWDWALRLRLQFPEGDLEVEDIVSLVSDVYRRHDRRSVQSTQCTVDLLGRLYARDRQINPWLYDLDESTLSSAFGHIERPTCPPSSVIIEIAPYTIPIPRRYRRVPQAGTRLILKASSDCFRIPLLRTLFDGWTRSYIHLARNPLASVNGLIDGWFHKGFWQHELSQFALPQSDHARTDHDTSEWWKFDLFSGWHECLDEGLSRRCARQWVTSHQLIGHYLRSLNAQEFLCKVAFEPFQRGEAARREMFRPILDFCGITGDVEIEAGMASPRVVNATVVPIAARWRKRASELLPLLDLPGIRDQCNVLGYDVDQLDNWT